VVYIVTDVSLVSAAFILTSAVMMETSCATDTLVATYQTGWCQRCVAEVCSEKHTGCDGRQIVGAGGSAKDQEGRDIFAETMQGDDAENCIMLINQEWGEPGGGGGLRR
jgi:hypothetical protein